MSVDWERIASWGVVEKSTTQAPRATAQPRLNRTYSLSEAAVNALDNLYEAGVARGDRTTRGDLVDAAIRQYCKGLKG